MKTTITILLSAAAIFAQSAPPPAFEVASVKPADPQPMGSLSVSMGGDAGRINYANVSMKDLLTRAYEVKQSQVSGPSWIDSERYNVTAKIPDGVPREMVPAMLRTLLAERFRLKAHRETKELLVYELIVGKGGPKLQEAKEDEPRGRTIMEHGNDGVMRANVTGVALENFTDLLGRWVGRPVIDKTGLKGNYNFALDLSMQDMQGMRAAMAAHGGMAGAGGGGSSPSPAPEQAPSGSLFTSIQKLGLKLEGKKAPIDLVFVDSAEKTPAEN